MNWVLWTNEDSPFIEIIFLAGFGNMETCFTEVLEIAENMIPNPISLEHGSEIPKAW